LVWGIFALKTLDNQEKQTLQIPKSCESWYKWLAHDFNREDYGGYFQRFSRKNDVLISMKRTLRSSKVHCHSQIANLSSAGGNTLAALTIST
jgi:mannose/cellobiose epimerase-like protein (N-acyl-D-glucosamine 2-epimerase family)